MHRIPVLVNLTILLAAATAWSVESAPTSINVQGKLTATGGGPVAAGNYTLAFKLFDVVAGGSQLWPPAGSENHLLAIGTDGLWSALLGKDFALLSNLALDTARYLEVTVTPPAGSPETFPRIRLGSTPFTLEASRLNGKAGDEYVEAAGDVMTGRLQIDYGSNGTDIDLRQDGGTTAIVELSSAGSTKAQLVGATKGHLVLADNNGDVTAILDATPSSGGVLDLNQEDGTNGALLTGGNTSDGAALDMRNSGGSVALTLDAQEAQGGLIKVAHEDGSDGITIAGGTTAAGGGGSLDIRNELGNTMVRLDASGGADAWLFLNKENGAFGSFLSGGTTTTGGGLGLNNAAGSTLIRLVADPTVESFINSGTNFGVGTSNPDTRLHVVGGTEATLADGSGYLEVGDQNSLNMIMDNNEVQARSNAAVSPLYLQSQGGNVGLGSATLPDVPLHVNAGTDLTLADGSGFMLLGSLASTHMVFDNNEIQTRLSGVGTSMFLQANGGSVAIGTGAGPEGALDVNDSGGTVAVFNRFTNDGIIVSLQQDDAEVGTITVAGAVVSYNAFTGSHYGWTDRSLERGMLMVMTGDNRRLHDQPESEAIYGIEPSSTANDPRCLGAYLSLSEPSLPRGSENPHLVMAVGNGEMWVTDEGADVGVGDHLISSGVLGHAMKDNGRFAQSYIVARAAENVRWSDVVETAGGAKHKKISVLFESFVRDRSGAATDLTARTAELEKTLAQQEAELKALRATVMALSASSHASGGALATRP